MENLKEKYPDLEYYNGMDCQQCLCFTNHVVDFLQLRGDHEEAVVECDECGTRWLIRQ